MAKVWQGRIWTCDMCGNSGCWSENWQWYGSYRDLEDKGSEAVTVTCSDECRIKAGLPREVINDIKQNSRGRGNRREIQK
jgi:hypothetical protein